jgi:DNA-directed RNA polymerase subunit E"
MKKLNEKKQRRGFLMTEKVCRHCMRVLEGQNCPICGTSDLAEGWSGLLIILDAERSEIAKKLGVDIPDRFALKVR